MMWPLLQLDSLAQGLPCGSSAYPLDQRHLSQRVEGGWLILQQSLILLRLFRLHLALEVFQRPHHAVVAIHFGFPAEELAGAGDIGLAYAGMVLGERLVFDRALAAGEL